MFPTHAFLKNAHTTLISVFNAKNVQKIVGKKWCHAFSQFSATGEIFFLNLCRVCIFHISRSSINSILKFLIVLNLKPVIQYFYYL